MTSSFCVTEGWRQQSSERQQIKNWLMQARQLGFNYYSLTQFERCFWLCCHDDPGGVDTAATVRTNVDGRYQHHAWVVIELRGQALLVIAWREQTLLAALEVKPDSVGLEFIKYLTKDWLAPDKIQCALLLAGKDTRQLLAQMVWPVEPIYQSSSVLVPVAKLGSFQSIKTSPPWGRKALMKTAAIALLPILIGFAWYDFAPAVVSTPVVTVAATPSAEGIAIDWLESVPKQLMNFSYLAGWQVSRWHIDQGQQHLTAQASYGKPAELLAQVGTHWLTKSQPSGIRLSRPLPTSTIELNQLRENPSVDFDGLVKAIKQHWPHAQITATPKQTHHHYHWREILISLPDYDPFTTTSALLPAGFLAAAHAIQLQEFQAKLEQQRWSIQLRLRVYLNDSTEVIDHVHS